MGAPPTPDGGLTHPYAISRPDVLPLPFMTQADALFMLSQGSEAAAYTAKILCKIRASDGTFNTTFLPLTKVNMIRNGTETEGGNDVIIYHFSMQVMLHFRTRSNEHMALGRPSVVTE